jgi:hypothetical protein
LSHDPRGVGRTRPWWLGPGLLIGLAAVALVLGASALAPVSSAHSSLVVSNRTTSPIAFDTGDGRAIRVYAEACSNVEFDLVGHEWRLRTSPVPAPSSGAATFVDVRGLIPPNPDVRAEAWRIVMSPDRTEHGFVPPDSASRTPPPCDGPPRQPVHLSGDGSAELGTYRLSGSYEMTLSIDVPGGGGCDVAGVAAPVSGGSSHALLPEQVVYATVRSQSRQLWFDPGTYEISVLTSCGTWDVFLAPR